MVNVRLSKSWGPPRVWIIILMYAVSITARSEDTAQAGYEDIDSARTFAVMDSDYKPEDKSSLVAAAGSDPVDGECRRIGGKLGSVSYQDCISLAMQLTDGISVRKAPILIKEFPPLETRRPLGKVLLLGGIHGDEYSSVSIVFKWLEILQQHHSGLFHWRIVPLMNPDGLLQKQSVRVNANGVDLNRNFPIQDWNDTAIRYWLTRTNSNPRRYPGPQAVSEPETAWLVDEIERFSPDVIISVHAPHGVVDYDGPRDGPYKLGRLYLNLLGTYPGSLGNYAGIQKQLPVVTIELPYAGIMPAPSEVSEIWRDLVRWLTNNIPANTITGKITQETDPS